MNSLQVEPRSVQSFCTQRSEIPASSATSEGPKSDRQAALDDAADARKQLVRMAGDGLGIGRR
jgi:xanthine dehydrogenase molybdopterin-binding subunit B